MLRMILILALSVPYASADYLSRSGATKAHIVSIKTPDNTWPQEPTAFRGIPWGSSEKDAKAITNTNFRCFNNQTEMSVGTERICNASFMLDPVGMTVLLIFSDGKFVSTVGDFNSDDYTTVRTVFVEKYGPPTTTSNSAVKTRMGVEYQQEQLTWVGPNIHIKLSRFGSEATEGSFIISTQEYRNAQIKILEENRKKLKDAF